MELKPLLRLFGIGMVMGAAEVVPGVSGGSIAFITGIYERLLNAIKQFTPMLLLRLKGKGSVQRGKPLMLTSYSSCLAVWRYQ